MGQISRFMLTADFDYHLPPELIASEPHSTGLDQVRLCNNPGTPKPMR